MDDGRLLIPGRTCWRMARADRFADIVDAADYFHQGKVAMLRARRHIILIGWDFDTRTPFERGGKTLPGPNQLGAFLGSRSGGDRPRDLRVEVEPAVGSGVRRHLGWRDPGRALELVQQRTDALRHRRQPSHGLRSSSEAHPRRRCGGVLRRNRLHVGSLGYPRTSAPQSVPSSLRTQLRGPSRGRRCGGRRRRARPG